MTDYMQRNIYREKLQTLKPLSNLRQSQVNEPPPTNLLDQVDNRNSPASIDYKYEINRLQSYSKWPVPYMDPAKMASAGFYYIGIGDKVQCFECGITIHEWVEGDNPMSDHQRWQSNCRFVRMLPCGNVPIGADPSTIPQASPRSRDVCGHYGEDVRRGSMPSFCTDQSEFQYPSTAKLGSLGLATQKGPVHPEYASYDARLRTFDSWPADHPHTKEQLADAGFYYTGTGDQTSCYHCGGGLKYWEPEDDPWIQHAKWFKKCYYVLMVKGQAFINNVTGQPLAPPTREEALQMNLPSYIKKVEPAASAPINAPLSAPVSAAVSAESDEKPQQDVVVSKPPTSKSSDDARSCKICYNEELGVVFLPCGHMVACTKCAPGMTTCAVCREPVSMTVRAIIS